MPEGDTIYRSARTLNRALAGKTVTRFETQLPKLARVEYDTPITGRTVDSATAQGKWLLITFSGNLILLTHMLMSGTWHIYRPGETWQKSRYHMRIVIETHDILAVAFNVPVAEFHTPETLARREGFRTLGSDILSPDFDIEATLASIEQNPDLELGIALLRQYLIAGLGNVYKSETCFVARINPFRQIKTLTRDQLHNILEIAKKLIRANVSDTSGGQIITYTGIRRTTGSGDHGANLWVYRRTGEPCRQCGTPIKSHKQGPDARTSFWCPQCQPM